MRCHGPVPTFERPKSAREQPRSIVELAKARPDLRLDGRSLRSAPASTVPGRREVLIEVLGRKPFGGALVVRIGSGAARHEFDLAEEVASALWVHSESGHPGCSLE